MSNIFTRLCNFYRLITEASETTEPILVPESEDWEWLLDLERSVALAIGRCLGGMLQGLPSSIQERTTEFWLCNPLLRNGLEMDFEQLGNDHEAAVYLYCVVR